MAYITKTSDWPKREAVVKQALLNVAKRLDINQRELARIIAVSEPTISRLYNDAQNQLAYNSASYKLALLLIRLFRSLDAIVGGSEENTRIWFHSFNHHLNGVPAELTTEPEGLVGVVNYLDAMRGRL